MGVPQLSVRLQVRHEPLQERVRRDGLRVGDHGAVPLGVFDVAVVCMSVCMCVYI